MPEVVPALVALADRQGSGIESPGCCLPTGSLPGSVRNESGAGVADVVDPALVGDLIDEALAAVAESG